MVIEIITSGQCLDRPHLSVGSRVPPGSGHTWEPQPRRSTQAWSSWSSCSRAAKTETWEASWTWRERAVNQMLHYPLKVTPRAILISFGRQLYIFHSASINSFTFLPTFQQLKRGMGTGNVAKIIRTLRFGARPDRTPFLTLSIYAA